ncbi:AAA family ATPase, partial [Flavobacterium sp. LBUM151]
MITKITLNQIASYKKTSILETDKKVNLIYGLNGSGKSTLSNFLAKKEEQKYHKCNIEGLTDDHELHVYNQSFIYNNFFEPENLNGIFTLSKANRDAEIKINAATKYILEKSAQKEIKEKELEIAKKDFIEKQLLAKNKVWEIKTSYTGGDRVLEFCLEGLKSDGNKLLSYIESLAKPITKPSITIEQIKEDIQSLTDENAKIYDMLPLINFMGYLIEDDKIFEKQIVGNKNSSVSAIIDNLGNSDWVKEGLKFLEFDKQINDTCPFCQEKT